MSNNLRDQIYRNLNTRESDELLEIWQENNRAEWSDAAFDAIREILTERLGNIPSQDEPIYEHVDDEVEVEDDAYGFSEEELAIIDDDNPPDFYNPFEVLKISSWLEWAAKAAIILTIVISVPEVFRLFQTVQMYFVGNQSSDILSSLITLILTIIGLGLQIALTYFPLRALAHILKVLMQMEFNSRPRQSE